jgi:multiple sugar transport system substrate-binding protein
MGGNRPGEGERRNSDAEEEASMIERNQDQALLSRRRVLGGTGATAVALLAAACDTTRPGGGPAPAAQNKAPYTLQVWENARFKWREDIGKEITDPFLAANPWLTLDSTLPAGVIRDKFLAAAAAGTPPDIYSGGSLQATEDFLLGTTISLEKHLATSKLLRKGDIWESLRRAVEFKGHVTAIPYSPDTRILFTHVENAQRAGLDPEKPPAKWSDMEAAALKAFKGSGGAVQHVGWYPFAGSGGNYLWMVPYWQLGGELISADQTKITLLNDRAIEALTWLKKVVDGQGGWQAIDAFRKQHSTPSGEQVFMEGGFTYLHATLSERGEQFNIKAPTMKFTISSYPLPDRGGSVANYGGCHAFPIAKGSKNPEAAWQFIEHVTGAENNIKFAIRFDRVPIRESSTTSPAYVQGDKGRALQAQEMRRRRFVLEVPGGGELLPLQDVVTPFMSGQLSLQDALKERERQAQEVLDRWLERGRTVNP